MTLLGAQESPAATNVLFSDVVSSIPLGHACHVLPAVLPGKVDLASAGLLVEKLSASDAPASLVLDAEECAVWSHHKRFHGPSIPPTPQQGLLRIALPHIDTPWLLWLGPDRA